MSYFSDSIDANEISSDLLIDKKRPNIGQIPVIKNVRQLGRGVQVWPLMTGIRRRSIAAHDTPLRLVEEANL
jgi:hypothetical protein